MLGKRWAILSSIGLSLLVAGAAIYLQVNARQPVAFVSAVALVFLCYGTGLGWAAKIPER
jgi:hypothetical protein